MLRLALLTLAVAAAGARFNILAVPAVLASSLFVTLTRLRQQLQQQVLLQLPLQGAIAFINGMAPAQLLSKVIHGTFCTT